MKHWEDTTKEAPKDTSTWYWNQPRPANVEMTGYALLTYMEKNQIADGLPIIRWLASKRNSLGGFSSTQVYLRPKHCFDSVSTFSPKERDIGDARVQNIGVGAC